MKIPRVEKKSVLITGCSTGIGRAAAQGLRKRGWHVIPTARREQDMTTLREEGFMPVSMDLADSVSVRRGFEEAMELTASGLGAVVNNAGYGLPGAVEDIDRDSLRHQFEVNVFGLQELTNLCIPGFRARGYGRIVNISSVLGRIYMPFLGAYCASKHALEILTDALRVELRGTGIGVSLIEPGPIATSFNDTARVQLKEKSNPDSRFKVEYQRHVSRTNPKDRARELFTLPPEAVERKISRALESRRPARRYCVTFPAYAGAFMRRFMPDAVLDVLLLQRMKGKAAL